MTPPKAIKSGDLNFTLIVIKSSKLIVFQHSELY